MDGTRERILVLALMIDLNDLIFFDHRHSGFMASRGND
jgi:hypothetical protein